MIKYIITSLLFLLTYVGFAQQGTITILSKEDQKPLPHAVVRLSSTDFYQHLVTDSMGILTIPSVFQKSPTIQINIDFIGFEPIIDKIKPTISKTYFLTADVFLLNEVVITGQITPTTIDESVHQVRVITAEKIQAQGAVNLKDVLQNETNIRISQDNILGSSMSIQGISGQNVKILIDGVPVIGRLGGNIDLSQINLQNIERIEIIEGPLSVNYGTDALAGTINLITKKTQKNKHELSFSEYYESVGQHNFSLQYGFQKKKNKISLLVGRNDFDGWSSSDNLFNFSTEITADSSRFQDWKPKKQHFAELQFKHQFKKLQLVYNGSYFTETITNRGKPRKPLYETAFDDFYRTNRIDNSILVNGQLTPKKRLDLVASYKYYERNKNTYYKDLNTLTQELTGSIDQDTSVFTLLMSRATISQNIDTNKLNYQIGYDVSLETNAGKRIENQLQEMGDYALFSMVEYRPITQLVLKPGIRYGYNTAYKAPIIPSLHIQYKLKKHTFRASYARGFRSPSLKELYFNFVDVNHNIVGNQHLQAETSSNFQASVTYVPIQKWTIKTNVFYNKIQNMITLLQEQGSSFSYFNIENFQTKGLRIDLERKAKRLTFSLGGAYMGRYNLFYKEENLSKFNYTPEVRSSISYRFQNNLQFNIFYKYTGKVKAFYRDETTEEIRQGEIQGYQMMDITCSKSFWKKRIMCTIGAKNLLNVQTIYSTGASASAHSSNSGSLPMSWGRSVFIALKINLNEILLKK